MYSNSTSKNTWCLQKMHFLLFCICVTNLIENLHLNNEVSIDSVKQNFQCEFHVSRKLLKLMVIYQAYNAEKPQIYTNQNILDEMQ